MLLTAPALAGQPQVGNGRIAFTKETPTGQQIFTILPDGTGETQLTFQGTSTFPGWSRDGSKIAFSSTQSGISEIWSMNADGTNQTRITFATQGGNFIPEWSPDGTKIAYASLQDATGHPEVWVMNADGTNQTRLTFTPVNQNAPTWSVHPSWSPDGQQLVYASTATGNTEIWMMNADGSNQTPITNGNGPQFPDSNASEWSRDGSTIAFWSGFETQFGEVWIMNPDGTNRTQLTQTQDPFNSDNPVWSPDGSKIIFDSNRAGPVQLWIINADGTNPTPLVDTAGGPASWQPVVTTVGAPVPTVSQLSMVAMTLILLVTGVMVLRRSPIRVHPVPRRHG